MKISIWCSDRAHPVFPRLERWAAGRRANHEVGFVSSRAEAAGGDLLFLISCNEIVPASVRGRYRKTLVIHASDLPRGRGWSPYVWQVLEGKNRIPVTLLEAEDAVDSGAIWAQRDLSLEGHELFDEIAARLFELELELMDLAVDEFDSIRPRPQDLSKGVTHYRRRTPADSRLDPEKSIAAQFDLLRVCDGTRFPAFFDWRGHRYALRLEKIRGDQP